MKLIDKDAVVAKIERRIKVLNEKLIKYAFQNGEALFTFRLPAKTYLVGSKVNVIIKQE